MDKKSKTKAKISLCFALNAFLLGSSASYGGVAKITQTDDLSRVLHEDKGLNKLIHRKDRAYIQDAFVEDFLQGPSLKKRKKLILREKIGQGGIGAVYKAEQNGTEYIVKQAIDETAMDEMEDEHQRTLSMYNAADKLVRTPDSKNVYGKLLGLGVIVPVIGTTKDGGIVQAYANGEDLRKSATCATQEGLRVQIDDELKQILRDSVKSNMNSEAMTMLCSKEFWNILKDLADQLFNKAVEKPQPDVKTLVQKCLLEDDQVRALVDSQKFNVDYHKIESLVTTLRKNRRIDFFNEHGFPRNPQQAIRVLCSFFYALVTLHELGYVHCDLKPDNVILTQDKIGTEDNTVLKLIDLGALTPIGERIGTHSNNGAPEVSHSSGIYEKPILIAQPSYDIYCTTGIILGCLFGYSGIQADTDNFWPETMFGNSLYVQKLIEDPDFRSDTDSRRFDFFSNMLQDLNTTMGQYGNNYPLEVLNTFAAILFWITKADWRLRPSAIAILEKLQELALSDWSSGKFRIQIRES